MPRYLASFSISLMEFMDFVKCSKYRTEKSCCGEKTTMDSENGNNEYNTEDFELTERRNIIENVQSNRNVEPTSVANTQDARYENFSKPARTTNRTYSVYQPSSELFYNAKDETSTESVQEETFSSLNVGEDKDFRCPRCGKRMQEPRLLPCLHPICSPCVSELMAKPLSFPLESGERICNFYEVCPLCDFRLPNANSAIPPTHYPLQHRLVMDAIRCRLANRVLCDSCPDEVVAHVQCSTCLRNFCTDCGMEHQQQITMELRPSKHLVKPLWEATKVRRTALCQKHPTHALRYYCIACQQVTCKECIWSVQHRGHASENVAGAGRRAALYLTTMLRRAKALLNTLLTQYDREIFSSSSVGESQNMCISSDYRYVSRFTIGNYLRQVVLPL